MISTTNSSEAEQSVTSLNFWHKYFQDKLYSENQADRQSCYSLKSHSINYSNLAVKIIWFILQYFLNIFQHFWLKLLLYGAFCVNRKYSTKKKSINRCKLIISIRLSAWHSFNVLQLGKKIANPVPFAWVGTRVGNID